MQERRRALDAGEEDGEELLETLEPLIEWPEVMKGLNRRSMTLSSENNGLERPSWQPHP
jgi:hypothetical protein